MHELVGPLARGVIGVVLLVSGTLKARDRSWPAAAAAFGAPRLVVSALPWGEIVLGAALVAQLGRRWTGGAALALLLAFTVAIAVKVGRGDAPPCACFGQVSTAPVGPATLARNLALCALALVGTVAR